MNVRLEVFERLIEDVRVYARDDEIQQMGSWPDLVTDWKMCDVLLFKAFALGEMTFDKKSWQELFAGDYAGTPKGHRHILGKLISTAYLMHYLFGVLAGMGMARDKAHFLDKWKTLLYKYRNNTVQELYDIVSERRLKAVEKKGK